jgi:hypothetical protein
MISENINKIRTNSSIILSKKSMKRIEDSNNYIFCNNCNSLLGFDLKYFKDEENEQKDYNIKIPKEINYYLLKKNIKERNNREIIINLVSFKESLLKNIKNELNNIFNDVKNINIKINLTPLTKQNFEDFPKFYKKKEFDFTFIIHKMEGRIFLLGKNGYFNSVENCLTQKQNLNLFFILISNEINEDENNKIIEELIFEGGEERLEKYYKKDKIIFLDNYNIENDIKNKKEWFISKIKKIYENGNTCENKNRHYLKGEKIMNINDKRKIDSMIEYLNNREKKGLGCFS